MNHLKTFLIVMLFALLSACCKDPVKVETVRYVNVPISTSKDLLVREEVPEPYTLKEVGDKTPAEVYKVMGAYQVRLLGTIKTLNDRLDLISKNQDEQIRTIQGVK